MGWDAVVGTVLTNFVLPILLVIVLSLISLGLNKLRQKYNLSISADLEKSIMTEAEVLVRAGEEKMADAAKKGAASITGQQAMAGVINGLIAKFPALTPEQAQKYGNAVVQSIPGIGATG
jgi:hypothetical protein